jgi:hypothetical protein
MNAVRHSAGLFQQTINILNSFYLHRTVKKHERGKKKKEKKNTDIDMHPSSKWDLNP